MEWMLFDHAMYDKMYNCSFLSYEEWASLGHVNIPMGIIYIVMGLIYIPLYIAFLIVMLRPEFIQYSCYKIMFCLGIIDIIAVFVSTIISGYLSLVGAVFCTHPALTYIGGGLGLGCWCSTCATALLLAFNRLLDLTMPYLADSIFHGKRIFAWLVIPICYGLYYWWFSCPCLYNSNFYAWFLDPYFGLPIDHLTDVVYANFLYSINNIAIVVALGTVYFAISLALIAKTRFINSKPISAIQRQTILQAALICFLIFFASAIYVYMQFFPTPAILIIVAQFFWQASHEMEWMLFDHAKYDKMYNCSFLSYEEWASLGHVNIPMGIIYIVVGLIYIPTYIALLIVMLRPEFIQHSCYKIMFYLGIIDITAVFDSAIISGYLSLVGAVFCTHPALTYIGGGLGLGCWCSTCATVLLLAFNRLLDLAMPHLSDSIFHGKRIYAWLLIPICYGLYYWWFSCPCLYNSNFYACFLDPYFGLLIDHQTDVVYANFLFSINNIAIIVALGTVYIAIICALIAKTRFANSKSVSAIQRQTIIQAALICFLIFVASAIYVYMQFFPTPTILIIVAQFFWQASHGGSAFIYLIFNKSMRRATIQMIFRTKTETKVTALTNTSSKNTKTAAVTITRH